MTQRSRKIRRLFLDQEGRCYLCGRPMTLEFGVPNTATIEHKRPRSRFRPPPDGRTPHDVAAACYTCNRLKGTLTDAEFTAGFGEVRQQKSIVHPFVQSRPTLRRLIEAMQNEVDAYGREAG